MQKLKNTFNPKYHRYLQRSMKAVKDKRLLSLTDEVPLPILSSENCDFSMKLDDIDMIIRTVSSLPGSLDSDYKLDLIQLPLFKNLMFNLLEEKLKFDLRSDPEEIEKDKESANDCTTGRITSIEKLLNIGKVEPKSENDSFNKVILSLSMIFRIAVSNFFIIPEDLDSQFSSTEGLQLLAYLNSHFMCLPVNMHGHLLRNFFRNFLYYSTEEFLEKIQIIMLYWPHLKQVQNMLALTRLDDNGYSDFLNEKCKLQPYDSGRIQLLRVETILSYSQIDKLAPPNNASMNSKAESEFVTHNNIVSNRTRSGGQAHTKRSSSEVVDPPAAKKARLSENEVMKRIRELMTDDDPAPVNPPIEIDSNNSKNLSITTTLSKPVNQHQHQLQNQQTQNVLQKAPSTLAIKPNLATTKPIASSSTEGNKVQVGEYIDFHVVGPINRAVVIFAVERSSKHVQVIIKPAQCDIPKEAIEGLRFIEKWIQPSGKRILNVTYSDQSFDSSPELQRYLAYKRINKFHIAGYNNSMILLVRHLFSISHRFLELSRVPLRYWMFALSHTVSIYNQGHEECSLISRSEVISPMLNWPDQPKAPYGCYATVQNGSAGVFIGFSSNLPGAYILNCTDFTLSKVVNFKFNAKIFPFAVSTPGSLPTEPVSEFALLLDPKLIK